MEPRVRERKLRGGKAADYSSSRQGTAREKVSGLCSADDVPRTKEQSGFSPTASSKRMLLMSLRSYSWPVNTIVGAFPRDYLYLIDWAQLLAPAAASLNMP